MIECFNAWGINDVETAEFIIEQLNVKLTTGEAHTQLEGDDYLRIVEFVKTFKEAPQASQVVQRVGDYVTANPNRFMIEEREEILHSMTEARYKFRVGESIKQTPEDIRQSIRTGFNLTSRPDIDLGNSVVDDSYTLFLKKSKTKM